MTVIVPSSSLAPPDALYADELTASPLSNADLAPTTLEQRTWSVWSITALWVSMCACIPTYMLASGLIDNGMNWWQAIATIFLANVIVLVPMVLNAHAGTRYGIPFPVYCRAAVGTAGANVPAMVRALVGCGWFGIQSWIGGQALFAIACIFRPKLADPTWPTFLGVTGPQFAAYGAFWLLNLIVIVAGINSIRWLLNIKAPLLIALGFALLGWAYYRANGFGDMLRQPSKFGPDWTASRAFWQTFALGLTGMVGFWATLSLNIPDFSRYAKSQRDQIVGQAIGLPPTMALFAFIGVAVTSATPTIFGKTIWNPVELIQTFKNPWALGLSMGAVAVATLATNIAANVVSPANDFAHLAPRFIGFRLGGLITGIVGTLMMPWYLLANAHVYIDTWLVGISALLGAVGGVLVSDYWLVRRAKLSITDLYRRGGRYGYDRGINWSALLAVAVAVAACVPGFCDQATGGRVLAADTNAVAFVLKQLYAYGVFVTFAIAFVAYALFMAGHPNARMATEPVATAVELPTNGHE
ncbi:MAG: Cytosine/purine/uracil/thiamine/allantoin permease family protein [Phycisphaerales bacterium]|nr:Cytosine/purine/uracil/thiamine/allantoin permease family protein [Phycisphaerales bacterium]